MSGDVIPPLPAPPPEVTLIDTPAERWAVMWHLRQRKLARLRCVDGHDSQPRSSAHLGTWWICVRCGLIEERDEPEGQA